jgi:glycosyltransferase involved in cell wall biosynthesis
MDERLPISVLLLARDEAARLAALLPTLAFAAEVVVVVDAASRDATRDVAERLGARVFTRALDGFGAQRAFALAQCTQPWVLWIDGDERLDEAARADVARRVRDPGACRSFDVHRVTYFLGRRIRYCGWQGERVRRLFARDGARFDDAPVHERVDVPGPHGRLAGVLEHHSYATWGECRDKLVRYAAAGAEKARGQGRRAGPLDPLVRPPLRFLRMYVLQLGFLDGAAGLMVCLLAAAQVFLKYAELWAGRRTPRGDGPR